MRSQDAARADALHRARIEATRQAARRLVEAERPPGLSICLVDGERPAWSEGFGRADIDCGRPASAETAYLLFSMTKIVTATAAVQLAERGLVDLDGRVAAWLPAFRSGGGRDRVTVRHLLSHSAGLANPIPVGWVRTADSPPEDQHEFTRRILARHARLRARPGTRASYFNFGCLLLGEVVAASGQSCADCVRANVLDPLGMDAVTGAV